MPDENEINTIVDGNTDSDIEYATILTKIEDTVNVRVRFRGVRLASRISEQIIVVIIPYYFF